MTERVRGGLNVGATRWAIALTGGAVLTWAWVSWRIDRIPPVDETLGGETGHEGLRWTAGTLSSLGSLEARVVVLAIVLTGLFAARRYVDGLFVIAVVNVVHALERVVKADQGRWRPPDPEGGYFLSDPIRLALLVTAVGGATIWWWVRGGSPWRLVSVGALSVVLYMLGWFAGAIDVPARSSSFPSGHAANTMALAAALLLIRRRPSQRRVTVAVVAVAAVYVLSIGWSRVALGYHHPTDVIAGWALAIVVAVVLDAGRLVAEPSAPLAVRAPHGPVQQAR